MGDERGDDMRCGGSGVGDEQGIRTKPAVRFL